MIWHIVTRELLDHLTSLRFALTTLILVALMVTNAVVHLQTHPERIRKYSENVSASHTELKFRTQLYALLQKGPGKLYKRPSSLTFIADGGDAFLPSKTMSAGSWRLYGSASIWAMGVPRLNMEAISNHRPTAVVIDWGLYHHLSALPSFRSSLPLMHSQGNENEGRYGYVSQIPSRVLLC